MTTASADALSALAAAQALPIGVDAVKVAAWIQAVDELAAAKVRELELREEILAAAFPGLGAGTTNLELGGGYGLQAVLRLNHKLDDAKTRVALQKLRDRGPVGALLADRLVKFKPELAVGEYSKLPKADAALFRTALTITPGTPSLKLTAPKG